MSDAAASLAPPALFARRRDAWRRLRRNPVTVGALTVVAVLVLVALLASVIAPFDPNATDPVVALTPPSPRHWLGTDVYGRDLLSRLIHAAQLDLLIPFGA